MKFDDNGLTILEKVVGKMRKIFLFFLLFVSFFAVSAVDFNPNEAYGRFKKGVSFGGALFPVVEKESFLLELDLYGSFEFSMLGFGIGLPVRFLLVNKDNIPTTGGGAFPKEDWDDARDWVSILSYFHYGHSGDMFYFYFGEQRNRYVGNGSIVGAYFGDLKLFHPTRGVNLEVNSDYAGLDFFIDDVIPPNVVGGRAYIKPLSFFNKESYGNNLEIGASYFADVSAPDSIIGEVKFAADKKIYERDISVASKPGIQIFGFDVNFRLLAMKYYQLTIYADINHIADAGTGLHFGAKHKLMLPGSKDMQILSKWEARVMESDYIPSYFNTFYDIEREYYKSHCVNSDSGECKSSGEAGNKDIPATKSHYVKDHADGKWTGGYYFDLVFDMTGVFSIGASFEHNKMYDYMAKKYNNYQINVFLNTHLPKSLSLDLLMTFQSLGEDGRRLKNAPYFNASAAYDVNKYCSVGLKFASKWHLPYPDKKDSDGKDQEKIDNGYKHLLHWSLGAFAGLRF